MRVCFYTLGCKVNQNETGALAQLFEQNGFTVVEEKDGADVYVVNSCTVTNFGDQKSRKWLRRAKRENPGAVTVLTGCYPQAFPEEAAKIEEADVVTGSGNRHAILQDVQKVLNGEETKVVDIRPHQKGESFEELPMDRFADHTRAFVKVEDGCNRRCAYCVIPRARVCELLEHPVVSGIVHARVELAVRECARAALRTARCTKGRVRRSPRISARFPAVSSRPVRARGRSAGIPPAPERARRTCPQGRSPRSRGARRAISFPSAGYRAFPARWRPSGCAPSLKSYLRGP